MRVTIQMKEPAGREPELRFGMDPKRNGLGPNPLAVLGSVCLHICGIALVVLISTMPTAPPIKREAIMIPLESEKLVWYVTKDRLPEVSGAQSKVGKPKVQLKRPGQVMTADAVQPGKQFIWQPAPKITFERETPLPNLLAFIPKPARPEPRKFVPPERTKPVREQPRVLPEPAPVVTAPALPAAVPLLSAIPGPARPRPRDFVPPVSTPGVAQPTVILEAAPSLAAQTPQPSVVVVGLAPAKPSEIPLPEGSRAARFSAGPESGAGGGEHAAAIVVPGLNVHGNGTGPAVVGPTRKAPAPYHEPSPVEWTQAASGKDSRRIARSMLSVALQPSARIIAPFVESRFANRPLYTTSFELGQDGSMEWVVWFAEQTARNDQYMTIRPPVPWSRTGTEPEPTLPPGRFQIAAVIDKGGQPGSVTVLSGGDPAAKEMAAKLIAEWVFLPALRNGQPIAVDTLIEISFRRRP
jgi:Gram-negative bacterial TonB protein C-terminal